MITINNINVMELENPNKGALLRVLIDEWKHSDEYINIGYGINYYKSKNDTILSRKRTYTIDGQEYTDSNRSNSKIPHGFFKILVDQKKDYIASNPITYKADDIDLKILEDTIGKADRFTASVNQNIKNASQAGYSVWQIYTKIVNGKWQFKYAIVPSEQIIPIYDGTLEKNLMEVIKWYEQVEVINGQSTTVIYADWWNAKNHEMWRQLDTGSDFQLESEYSHYQIVENEGTLAENKEAGSWGRVPFIVTPNNSDFMTDLETVQKLIDDYDLNVSNSSDDLADILEKVLILKGYQGVNLKEFTHNLKEFGVIKTAADGSVDSLGNEIETEAKEKHLDRLEDNIYAFGQGVDVNMTKFGDNPSGVALKFMFSLLDLKSNATVMNLKNSLDDLLEFVNIYSSKVGGKQINIDNVDFVFNKGLIINEAEIITNLANSQLSRETYLSKHPYVANVQDELERLDTEIPEIVLPEEV